MLAAAGARGTNGEVGRATAARHGKTEIEGGRDRDREARHAHGPQAGRGRGRRGTAAAAGGAGPGRDLGLVPGQGPRGTAGAVPDDPAADRGPLPTDGGGTRADLQTGTVIETEIATAIETATGTENVTAENPATGTAAATVTALVALALALAAAAATALAEAPEIDEMSPPHRDLVPVVAAAMPAKRHL